MWMSDVAVLDSGSGSFLFSIAVILCKWMFWPSGHSHTRNMPEGFQKLWMRFSAHVSEAENDVYKNCIKIL